jgi:3-phosphoshikimate 1-carboxyvinyltransferase
LREKESDRIETLTTALRAIGVGGARIKTLPDGFSIRGVPSRPRGGTIDAAGDHRIAILGAIAGAVSRQGVEIVGPECAAISFPGFYDLLSSVTQQ